MPLFQIDIQKTYKGSYWTNRYTVEGASVTAFDFVVDKLVAAEKAIHNVEVIFNRARVTDLVPDNDNFVIIPLTGTGTYGTFGNPLPLFNVVRVDLNVSVGRPSRKYYRTVFGESEVDGDHWSSTYFEAVRAAMNQMIADVPELKDPDAQDIISAVVALQVGMHQQRRASKRKSPVI